METVKKEISLNVGQPNNFELICAMQGDNKSFEVTATLYDVNKLYTIRTNNIKLKGENPVGLTIHKNVDSHTANTVTFTLTEDMLMYDGILKLVLVLTENSTQLTTFPFVIKVINSPGNSTGDDIKTVSGLVEEAKKWALLSKSYAVGTDNEVREDDATDNSKYYYEQIKELLDSGEIGNGKILYFDTYEEFKKELDAGKIEDETLICIKEGNIDVPGDENNKNPIYLFNCENGTNLLGNIVKYGEWGISIPSSITVNSDGITVSVSKDLKGGDIFFGTQYNNFKIDDISKYSKIAVEFEYVSGCYKHDISFGYTRNNSSYEMIYPFYLNNGDSNNNNEIGISNNGKGKVILDSVSGIQHRELNQKVKDLLISTSTSYRLGFQIGIGSDNGIIDTIFRIKKIWIE